ncbi:Fc.00g004660.m01.CDS01 [Cosmosporella sp. VM-42]
MSSPYSVQIHQNTKEPSINSSYSYSSDSYASSGSSTPRSYSSGEYREYGAAKHTSTVSRPSRSGNLVINHGKVGYDAASPRPGYIGGYSRTS